MSVQDRIYAIWDTLAASQEAGRACSFITKEFMPLFWDSWREAYAACPPDLNQHLALWAQFTALTGLEKGLRQLAEQAPALEADAKDLEAEGLEALRQSWVPEEA